MDSGGFVFFLVVACASGGFTWFPRLSRRFCCPHIFLLVLLLWPQVDEKQCFYRLKTELLAERLPRKFAQDPNLSGYVACCSIVSRRRSSTRKKSVPFFHGHWRLGLVPRLPLILGLKQDLLTHGPSEFPLGDVSRGSMGTCVALAKSRFLV